MNASGHAAAALTAVPVSPTARTGRDHGPLIPEARLVLLSASSHRGATEFHSLLDGPLHWGNVVAIAVHQGASRALVRRFETVEPGTVPAAAATALRRGLMVTSFRLGYLEERLKDALSVLHQAGIPVVLLKGAALAVAVYRSFEERSMADVDLLVRREDAQRAQELLLGAGWRRRAGDRSLAADESVYEVHQHLPPLEDERGTETGLELHTDLFGAGHPFAELTRGVWRDARSVRLGDADVLVPSPVHLFVHCCVHFAWSHMGRQGAWRTFRDLHALREDDAVPWPEIVTEARRTNATTSCYWTLRLARDLSCLEVPDEILKQLAPPHREAWLRILGRHLASGVVPTAGMCPSVRISRWMWLAAIRPGWSDHGGSRPWDHSAEFGPRDHDEVMDRGVSKLVHHFRQAGRWRSYLASVLPLPAGRSSR
jgi:hypothetical protein